MADYIRSLSEFTLEGRAGDIRCPTLLTSAELDPLGKGAEVLYEALTCPKQLLRFTAAEGAGEHCEIMNRSMLNRRAFDWLDGAPRRRARRQGRPGSCSSPESRSALA